MAKGNTERCDHSRAVIRYEKDLKAKTTTAKLSGEKKGSSPDEGWTMSLFCAACGASTVGLPAGPLPEVARAQVAGMPEVEADERHVIVVSAALPFGALAFGTSFEEGNRDG